MLPAISPKPKLYGCDFSDHFLWSFKADKEETKKGNPLKWNKAGLLLVYVDPQDQQSKRVQARNATIESPVLSQTICPS